jgi:hypothetical protein
VRPRTVLEDVALAGCLDLDFVHLRAVFAGDHRAKQKVAQSRESVAIAAAVERIFQAGQGIRLAEIQSRALGALRTDGSIGTGRPGESGRTGHARWSGSA